MKWQCFTVLFICLIRQINAIWNLFIWGWQNKLWQYIYYKQNNIYNKKIYTIELGVGIYLSSRALTCCTKILTTLLRSETELKTKPTHSDTTVVIKVIISLLCLSVLFFNTHWSKTTAMIRWYVIMGKSSLEVMPNMNYPKRNSIW